MNEKPQPTSRLFKLDWKKSAIIAVVLVIGAYQWYTENNSADKPVPVATGQSGTFTDNDNRDTSAADKNNADPLRKSNAKSNRESAKPYLQPAGRNNLKSPAGLIYTDGREHRSDHVLRHANDIPDREGPHGVFDADGDNVFRLIDEAYELVKSNSRQVKTTPADGGKTEYIIDMKRKVGYLGGQTGNRKNNPPLYKVKLILGDNRVITAYPF